MISSIALFCSHQPLTALPHSLQEPSDGMSTKAPEGEAAAAGEGQSIHASCAPSPQARERRIKVRSTTLSEPLLEDKGESSSRADAKHGVARRVFGIQKESWGLMLLGVVFAFGSGGLPLVSFYYLTKVFTVMFQLNPDKVTFATNDGGGLTVCRTACTAN